MMRTKNEIKKQRVEWTKRSLFANRVIAYIGKWTKATKIRKAIKVGEQKNEFIKTTVCLYIGNINE